MAHRLHGGRVTLDQEPRVEVQPIVSDTVYRTAVGLASAYFAAANPAAVNAALERIVTFFCLEAQPTFEIVDHRGVVPATPAGMMRLSDQMALEIMSAWAEQFVALPPSTAVDEVYPPGPVRDELNRRLKAVA